MSGSRVRSSRCAARSAVVQAHEYTGGLAPGAPRDLGDGSAQRGPGPGLIGGIFDGMMRRLREPGRASASWGASRRRCIADRRWQFHAALRAGDAVAGGAILGTVTETPAIDARALVPPDVAGVVEWVADEGDVHRHRAHRGHQRPEVRLAHRWPLRRPRPSGMRIQASVPLAPASAPSISCSRSRAGRPPLFPAASARARRCCCSRSPSGATLTSSSYVSCGERGNELADVLHEISDARGPAHRTCAARAHGADRQHVEHAADGARGQRPRRRHRRRALPRHGLRRARHRRLHLALGRGAARDRVANGRAARRGGLPGEPGARRSPRSTSARRRVQTLAGDVGSVTILGAVSPPGGTWPSR